MILAWARRVASCFTVFPTEYQRLQCNLVTSYSWTYGSGITRSGLLWGCCCMAFEPRFMHSDLDGSSDTSCGQDNGNRGSGRGSWGLGGGSDTLLLGDALGLLVNIQDLLLGGGVEAVHP